MKHHVKLKPGVMMLKIQLCHHRNKLKEKVNKYMFIFISNKCSLGAQLSLDFE